MWELLSAIGISGSLWWGGNTGLKIAGFLMPHISGIQAALIASGLYLSFGGYYTVYLVYKTLPRDLVALKGLLATKLKIAYASRRNLTVPKLFVQNVKKHPDRVALIFEGRKWTFLELDEYSNRVANHLSTMGFNRLDPIALFMENRPEYIATWLGCAKLGLVPALINFNLRHVPLVHSINVVNSKGVICGAEVQNAVNDIKNDLKGLPILVSGLGGQPIINTDMIDFDVCLAKSSRFTVPAMEEGNFQDSLLYVYTSGTTGLPKAAIIKNSRFLLFTTSVNTVAKLNKDVIYNPLPLYHTAGGLIGIGQVLLYGCTAVIRKKFSVSNFWAEAKEYDCTIAQYVGEICRYLLNTPPKDVDNQHKIRIMFGNGMRANIWEDFVKRFNIPCIAEFYGATEGIANIMNFEGKTGACGFLSVLYPKSYPARLMKLNESTGELVRGKNGLCVLCKPGEPGEFVAKIRKSPLGSFHGYADKKATQKKIIRDVFQKGDSAFASGDILVMDTLGYVYFKDRLGDTFRWRGENVSTTEVEGVVSQAAGHKDVAVYGVEIPNTEGRAGMAAIVDPMEEVDMSKIASDLQAFLPPYARPLFVRVLKEIDSTGTFKLKKKNLQQEGFDIHKIGEKIFFLDAKKKEYVPLSEEIFDKLMSGKSGL